MKTIGVNGLQIVSTAATFSRAVESVALRRSPTARLPIWSWSWEKVTRLLVGSSGGIGAPCSRSRNDEYVPS